MPTVLITTLPRFCDAAVRWIVANTTCRSVAMRHGTRLLEVVRAERLDGNATSTAGSSIRLREVF
jgi:hypothetical protein